MDWAEELKFSLKKSSAKKEKTGAAGSLNTTASSPVLDLNLDISIENEDHPQNIRSPPRRISGGWADSASKKTRAKNLIEDERFKKSLDISPQEDEIPVIPDIDDIEDIMNEIVEPPSVTVNRVITLKELNSDLLTQKAFATLEDVDLSILTKCLQPQMELEEPDIQWEWDTIFTETTAEINTETPGVSSSFNENTDEISYLS